MSSPPPLVDRCARQPIESGIEVVVEAVRRPGLVHLAQDALLEQLTGGDDGWQEELIVGAHERDARVRHRPLHPVRLRQGQAERLLAEDMLAGLGRGDDRVRVEVMRQADIDRVDEGRREHLAVVDEHLVPRPRGRRGLGHAPDRYRPRP